MKRSEVILISVIAGTALAVVAVLQNVIPHEGYQGPNQASGLLSKIKRDRPAAVGNADAEAMLLKVERTPAVPPSGIIKVADETFSPAYDEIYNNREKYYGREITVSGYTQTDKLPSGQFLVGRDLVWCCQQDKYFIGFLVVTDEAIPRDGADLRVTGIIEAIPYKDPETGKTFDVPAIRAKKIESAPKYSRDVFPG
jgi:uncharacterized membrane protein YcgQ (UPF0703/DUF1980 family)